MKEDKRVIKFRAWDKVNKEMLPNTMVGDRIIYPFVIHMDGGISEKQSLHRDISEDIVLMQFTGLLDKQGKEIYEGDILKVDEGYQITDWYVKYCGNLQEGLGMGLCGYYLQRGDFESYQPLENRDDYEVIGNLYENP